MNLKFVHRLFGVDRKVCGKSFCAIIRKFGSDVDRLIALADTFYTTSLAHHHQISAQSSP